jgi:hypothetical protein
MNQPQKFGLVGAVLFVVGLISCGLDLIFFGPIYDEKTSLIIMFSGIAYIVLGLVLIAISGMINSSEPKPIPNSNQKFCSGCGNEVKSNDTYCPKCGNKL